MAPHYVSPNRQQGLLLPPSLRDWLPEKDYVWFVIETVERMDLSAFHAHARLDGVGAAFYDPGMMATLLVYAYSMGVRSSRRIE
ncbi:MAG: IS1182 family transposase, partial [Candidatus Riflebacteria bacterium]|nr:IS1182 family transposase [Candidatus Riflebacteria bacterium]